jgi:hypothetical protein
MSVVSAPAKLKSVIINRQSNCSVWDLGLHSGRDGIVRSRFEPMANIFPRWSNLLPLKSVICVLAVAGGVVLAFTYYATPKFLVVGYQPSQPQEFSHKMHVDQVGMNCRYCHSFVDIAGVANVPGGNTCWNCHQHVQRNSPQLAGLRRAMDPTFPGFNGKPLEWVRIHKTPDYVKFNHSVHVNRGIGCVSCHGQVDQMDVVYQDQSQSMGWCLACHRQPEIHLRPLEEVYNMKYDAAQYIKEHPQLGVTTPAALGLKLKQQFMVAPKTSCATCHH